ncbi:unnamed protein product [Rhizophagus irregularis]|nr:unnamed protein product [Rhizophagus irregularis]
MNAEAIRNSYYISTDYQFLERTWQMEFYQAATQILPIDIFISPDVGTYWGIDVSKEWAIIDIRHPGLPNDNPEYSADSHWINVYCQKNWKSVIIEDEDGRVEIKLMGEYL